MTNSRSSTLELILIENESSSSLGFLILINNFAAGKAKKIAWLLLTG